MFDPNTMRRRLGTLLLAAAFATGPIGCSREDSSSASDKPATKRILSTDGSAFPVKVTNPNTGVTWEILGIMTDGHDFGQAKANAEDALTRFPDLAAAVGLWAYNPPKILQAVKAAGKLAQVKIIGFDEDPDTLQAIQAGEIEGTIVQNPYGFGYKSTEYLAALVRGQEVELPKDKLMFIPTEVIRQENVAQFRASIDAKRTGRGEEFEADRAYDTERRVRLAFLTNSIDPFWDLAEQGCLRAAPKFNAEVSVLKPAAGKVEEQKQYIEEEITKGTEGLAISPIDPANQGDMINSACAKMKVITQDSDAPDTRRLFYIGTDNYAAGRQAGELVAKTCPDGGQVMIFVGKMEVLNAQERSQGVIDVLLGQ